METDNIGARMASKMQGALNDSIGGYTLEELPKSHVFTDSLIRMYTLPPFLPVLCRCCGWEVFHLLIIHWVAGGFYS